MAATATRADQIVGVGLGGAPGSRGGNGFHKNGGGKGGGGDFRFSPARYRIGVWVAMGSILMLFVALTSAYIVRSAAAPDWHAFTMPRVLWLSTSLLIVSSITIEIARRSLKQQRDHLYTRWLINTLVLGVGFVASQLFAWRQLAKQGVYLATNPYNSFFYLFTAAHGVHLLGGLMALTFLVIRTRQKRETLEGELRRVGAADAVSLYWHFMDALWIALFLLLMLWK
jgi:cytochrome c oxidase subunit III